MVEDSKMERGEFGDFFNREFSDFSEDGGMGGGGGGGGGGPPFRGRGGGGPWR